MRVFHAFGDASDGPAMDAVLKQLNTDLVQARLARAGSFLLTNGADIDSTLSDYQNRIAYLSGDGYQAVLAGTTPFSTGDTWAPGWLETAQDLEDAIASTTGVIGRTDFTSLTKNLVHNLPTPTGGPTLIPWYWWAIGGVLALGWMFSQAKGAASETKGIVHAVRGQTSGLGRYSRRRKRRS